MKAPAIIVDSVDWAAVARAYRLIRLSPSRERETPEELRQRYAGWLVSRLGSVEFDLALRMVFGECMAAERQQAQETEVQNSLAAFKGLEINTAKLVYAAHLTTMQNTVNQRMNPNSVSVSGSKKAHELHREKCSKTVKKWALG